MYLIYPPSSEVLAHRWFQGTRLGTLPSDYSLETAERNLKEGNLLDAQMGNTKLLRTQTFALEDMELAVAMGYEDYEKALKITDTMICLDRSFYYGHVRRAQVQLITKDYLDVFATFRNAYTCIRSSMYMRTRSDGAVKVTGYKQQSTRELDQYKDKALEILSLVAHECSKAPREQRGEKFKLASQIAHEYMLLEPRKYQGYLLAIMMCRLQHKRQLALLLCWQGRMKVKGRDLEVITTYSRNYDAYLESLVPNDILMRLPKAIVSRIFTYLPTDSILECMEVSDAWHMYINRLREPFRVINAKLPIDFSCLGDGVKTIQKIHLEGAKEQVMRQLSILLGQEIFHELREFSTDGCEYVMNDKIVLGLHNVTHLSIINDTTNNAPPLQLLLQMCTKLQHVVYHQKYPLLLPSLDFDENLSNITRLTIGCSTSGAGKQQTRERRYVDMLRMNHLLRQLTNLKFLHVVADTYKPMGFTSLVPTLNTLLVGIFDSADFGYHDDKPRTRKGLRYMRVSGNGVAKGSFMDDVIANARTLKTLWVGDTNPRQKHDAKIDTWSGVSPDVRFRKLIKLILSFTLQGEALKWLDNVPKLIDLTVSNLKDLDKDLFLAILEISTIKRLTLQWCQNCTRTPDYDLFRYLAHNPHRDNIEYLCLDQCILNLEKCLHTVAYLRVLRILKIHNCAGVDRYTIIHLMDTLAEKNRLLTEFELVGGGKRLPVNDRSFSLVRQALPNLEYLRLGDLKHITNKTVKKFKRLKEYKRLRGVYIHGCENIDEGKTYRSFKWVPDVIFED